MATLVIRIKEDDDIVTIRQPERFINFAVMSAKARVAERSARGRARKVKAIFLDVREVRI